VLLLLQSRVARSCLGGKTRDGGDWRRLEGEATAQRPGQSGRQDWSSATPAWQRWRRRWAVRPEANLFAGSCGYRRRRLSPTILYRYSARSTGSRAFAYFSRRRSALPDHRNRTATDSPHRRPLPAFSPFVKLPRALTGLYSASGNDHDKPSVSTDVVTVFVNISNKGPTVSCREH